VRKEDLGAIRRSRRSERLARLFQAVLVTLGAFLGYVGAEGLSPAGPNSSYPYFAGFFAPMAAVSSGFGSRKSWIVSLLLSAAAFFLTFVLVASAHDSTYGATPRYGVVPAYGVAGKGLWK